MTKPKTEAEKKTEELHDHLVKEMQQPPREDWQTYYYTPEQGAQYALEVSQLEAQLDQGWPGWRQKEPFGHLSNDKIGWIKLRLKRRDLIVCGNGHYGVRLAHRAKGRPLAVPVIPRGTAREEPFRPVSSIPILSRQLGARPAVVADLLETLPPGVRDVRGWMADQLERRAAPPPEVSPPPASEGVPALSRDDAPADLPTFGEE